MNPTTPSSSADDRAPSTLTLRAVGKWLGVLITLAALGFVVWQVRVHFTTLRGERWSLALGVVVCVAAGIYAGLSVFLMLAWRHLLVHIGHVPLGFADGLHIFARSQIGKYLPGNVGHVLLRQGLGAAYAGQSSLMVSTLFEIGCYMVTAIVLGYGGYLLSGAGLGADYRGGVAIALPLAIGAPIAGWFALRRLAARWPRLGAIPPFRLGPWLRGVLVAQAHFGLYLIGCGMIIYALADNTWVAGHIGIADWDLAWMCLWAAALASVAGLVTPGAPGGLGVREAVLTLLLTPHVGEAHALFTAVLFRLVTVAGDAGFWLVGVAVGGRKRHLASSI